MNRRTFFRRTLGALVAASAAPLLPVPKPLPGTWGALERSSVAFWRAVPLTATGLHALDDDGTYGAFYHGFSRTQVARPARAVRLEDIAV